MATHHTGRVWLWCPACDDLHVVIVEDQGDGGPVWGWDGNLTAPTVTPSILVTYTYGAELTPRTCHSFLTGGVWSFLGDCTHHLAGQTAPMDPLPDWLLSEAASRG